MPANAAVHDDITMTPTRTRLVLMPSARALARLLPVAITRQPKARFLKAIWATKNPRTSHTTAFESGPIVPEPNMFV